MMDMEALETAEVLEDTENAEMSEKSRKWSVHLRSVFLVLAVAVMSCASAFAAEPTPVPASGAGFTEVLSYSTYITSFLTVVWQMITSNGYFMFYLCFAILMSCVGLFTTMKNAARGK